MSQISSNIASFFSDPDASTAISLKAQQFAAPIVRGQDVTTEELLSGGGLRVVQFVIDRSPSMEPVADLLLKEFNTEFVPAIKAAREDDISALRIGGTSFSSDITPIWQSGGNSYHSLDQLPALTKREFDPAMGHATALHEAILDGTARAMRCASDLEGQTGSAPDVDVIILTDGGNNCAPMATLPVRTMIEGRNKTRVRFIYIFFQTDMGHYDPKAHALELGIDGENVEVFAAKQNESAADRAKRFRRMMRVMSKVSASKGMSAVKAAAGVPDVV